MVACKVFPRMNKWDRAVGGERLLLQKREDQGREQARRAREWKDPGGKAAADAGGSAESMRFLNHGRTIGA
jgi:hypothetical protein